MLDQDPVALLWIRKGNCSNRALVDWLERLWPETLRRLELGERLQRREEYITPLTGPSGFPAAKTRLPQKCTKSDEPKLHTLARHRRCFEQPQDRDQKGGIHSNKLWRLSLPIRAEGVRALGRRRRSTKTVHRFDTRMLSLAARCVEHLAGALDLFPMREAPVSRQQNRVPDGEANLSFTSPTRRTPEARAEHLACDAPLPD